MQVKTRSLMPTILAIFLLSTPTFATDHIDASVNLIVTIDQASSIGHATYSADPFVPGSMSGVHTIFGGSAWESFGPTSGIYEKQIEQYSMDGECYTGRIQASGTQGFNTGTINTPQKCVPCTICIGISGQGSVNQSPVGTTTSVDCSYHTCGTWISLSANPDPGWEFAQWAGDVGSGSPSIGFYLNSSKFVEGQFQLIDAECDPGACGSPILLNLDNSSYDLTGVDDTVRFDLDADGTAESTTWSAAKKQIAFLARDINGDGVVSNGRELFGNFTVRRDGTLSNDGFEALRDLDDDNNGLISSADALWADLILWVDANHNGFSEASEMSSIDRSDIVGIGTSAHTVSRRDSNGNEFRQKGQMTLADGQRRLIYDVWFVQP
jgi:hypothetical protein